MSNGCCWLNVETGIIERLPLQHINNRCQVISFGAIFALSHTSANFNGFAIVFNDWNCTLWIDTSIRFSFKFSDNWVLTLHIWSLIYIIYIYAPWFIQILFLFYHNYKVFAFKGSLQKKGQIWDFVPTGRIPPPQRLGHQIGKTCLFSILGYSEHLNFSWKCTILVYLYLG